MDTQPSALSSLVEGMSQVLHSTDIADFQPIFPRADLFRFLLSFLHRVSSLDLEAVLNCLFEGLRVKNFSFDRFFQGR